jgi:hypothetical protein
MSPCGTTFAWRCRVKILALAATSSTKCINGHLVRYAASQLESAEI